MEAGGLAAIIVATITAIAVTFGHIMSYRAVKESRDALRGNGRGTVTQMVEDIHKGLGQVQWTQQEQGLQFKSLLRWQVHHDIEHEREVEST
jgi:hypothetical protein